MGSEGLRERYINPYTDFGFKKLFGTELNKDLLVSFLNALLQGREKIRDITYLNSEHLGVQEADRRAVFDVYCENERGEKFLVEMQKGEQQFFKDRSIYYSTFPLREQAVRGDKWDYELNAVYTVGILNFTFDHQDEGHYHHEVKLLDTRTKEVFYDKLTFIYLEMPKFRKREEELETLFDKWMFVLKNLATLLDRPAALQERVFKRLFETAEIARFSESEIRDYEESLKNLRDLGNVLNTAKEEGRKEGRKEGIETMALRMRDDGMPLEVIAKYTGLSVEEIQNLKS